MKNRESILFWVIAISIMVFAMCVLSLQIVQLHQEEDLKRFQQHYVPGKPLKLDDIVSEKDVKSKKEEDVVSPESIVPDQPRIVVSKKLRTPKTIKQYERSLYDVPRDGNCGFWALLRGLNPEDELVRAEDIAKLKKNAAKCALETELGPSRQEVRRMFLGDAPLDTAMLPYVSHSLDRDIIVSSNEIQGYDLFTNGGETFHYDTIEEIDHEADNAKTIWLHNVSNVHWTVAIPNRDDDKEPQATYFLLEEGGNKDAVANDVHVVENR